MSQFKQLCYKCQNDINDAKCAAVYGILRDQPDMLISVQDVCWSLIKDLTEGMQHAKYWKQTAALGWFRADCIRLIETCEQALSSPSYN